MKYLIFLTLLFLSFANIYCQDKEPTTFPLTVGNRTFVPKTDSFPQDKFILGFQWSGTAQLIKALKMDSFAGGLLAYNPDQDTSIQLRPLFQPYMNGDNWTAVQYWYCPAIQYDPRLLITDPSQFHHFQYDPKNSIFGFKFNNFLHKINYICFC